MLALAAALERATPKGSTIEGAAGAATAGTSSATTSINVVRYAAKIRSASSLAEGSLGKMQKAAAAIYYIS
jgi:hypothetical protein